MGMRQNRDLTGFSFFLARSGTGLRTDGQQLTQENAMNERDIFIAALQKDDPAQREAYLAEVCAQRPGLREQIDGLLRLYQDAGSFLEQPAEGLAAQLVATADEPVCERPGAV